MRISIIAAMAANRVIGINNTLPWHLPEDLKRFKALTMNHHIIMGRNTYDSIGKPLPGRKTVIVTSNVDYAVPGCIAVNSLDAAMTVCHGDDEIFFVGGQKLYSYAMRKAERLYLTEIQREFEGDAFFPEFNKAEWAETAREIHHSGGSDGFEYHYVIYDRKSSS